MKSWHMWSTQQGSEEHLLGRGQSSTGGAGKTGEIHVENNGSGPLPSHHSQELTQNISKT